MLLATYTGIRPGIQGIGNKAIRWRLGTKYTHSEVLFEPQDNVAHLMPDGNIEPDEFGNYWCASSVFGEKLPKYSPTRAGKYGGVRFKRINTTGGEWVHVKLHFDPKKVATWFVLNQGMRYDYSLIVQYAVWLLPGNKDNRVMCSESIAKAIGLPEAERIDPAILHNLAVFLHQQNTG